MASTIFFVLGTLLLSLNFVRPFGLAISDWLYIISMGLALLETIIVDRKNLKLWTTNHFQWFAFLILLGGIISLVNSKNIKIALFEIAQQLYVITLFISLTWIMVRRGKTKAILMALILSGVFAAIIAAVDYITGSRLGPMLSGKPNVQFWERFAGPLGHPNKFGYFLVITSAMTFLFFQKERKWISRALWIFLFLIQIFGIYLSGSMTAYVGFVTSFLFLFIASFKGRKVISMSFAIGIITILIIIISFSLLSDFRKMNFIDRATNNITLSIYRVRTFTANSRWIGYKDAIEIILNSPIIGVGYDQVPTSNVGPEQRSLDVHNVLLQTWYTGGVLAFIGLIGIYSLLGFYSLKTLLGVNNREQQMLISVLASLTLAILIMDQFQDAIYQREKWLIIALFVSWIWNTDSTSQINEKERIKEKPHF